MTIERTALPGIGIAHAVTTAAHQRLGVISHVGGRRDLVVYHPGDPDEAAVTVTLDDLEARRLADLLAGSVTVDHVSGLLGHVTGITAVRIRVPAGSPFDGAPLRDTRARALTGVSVVAVVRDGESTASPDPDFVLRGDDIVVAVGDEHGITAFTALLAVPR